MRRHSNFGDREPRTTPAEAFRMCLYFAGIILVAYVLSEANRYDGRPVRLGREEVWILAGTTVSLAALGYLQAWLRRGQGDARRERVAMQVLCLLPLALFVLYWLVGRFHA